MARDVRLASPKGLFDLNGMTAIVTGGSGLLGRTFCRSLALHGATVALADLAATEPLETAARSEVGGGGSIRGFVLDVSDAASVSEAFDTIEQQLGGVDILVNNAATKGADIRRFFKGSLDLDFETWREIMNVNLDGAFLMSREMVRRLNARGQCGSVIQIASVYGVVAPDTRVYEGSRFLGETIATPPAYSASKAGLIGLTRYMAAEFGAQGVRVNCVSPGGVSSGQNSTFVDRYSDRVPMARMARAEDIAGAVVFLASPAANYITGQNIVVDGGLTAW